MNKLAYLDCPTGIAGDMCLGALVHAGVPLEYLIEKLNLLGISQEYRLWQELVQRNGQQATKIHVELSATAAVNHHSHHTTSAVHPHFPPPHPHSSSDHDHYGHELAALHAVSDPDLAQPLQDAAVAPSPPTVTSVNADHTAAHPLNARHLKDIEQLISSAKLPDQAQAWSLAVFRKLAEAEGAVHGVDPNQVHFHEVGATDAIVDIVGTCLGLDWLGIDRLYCSAMPVGGGTIRAAHGRLPVPTPAVLKLWEFRQVPIYSNGIERELVTPTGAAIAVTLAQQFGPPPAMTLHQVGLGAGSQNLSIPNILRLWIGEGKDELHQHPHATDIPDELPTFADHPTPHAETIAVLETQVDDLNPQAIGYLFDPLLAAGAVDVFTQAIAMKKSRLGTLVTVLCPPEQVAACETILFQETSTLGIRHFWQQRTVLNREIQMLSTKYGPIRVKVAWDGRNGQKAIVNVQPEYEDCAAIAREHHLPWREVHRQALQHWYAQNA